MPGAISMLRLLCLIPALVCAIATSAQTEQPFGEKKKHFKDWLAVCRGDAHCLGSAFVRPGSGPFGEAYELRIGRKTGPDTAWNISFTAIDHMPAKGRDITVEIDDNPPGP